MTIDMHGPFNTFIQFHENNYFLKNNNLNSIKTN